MSFAKYGLLQIAFYRHDRLHLTRGEGVLCTVCNCFFFIFEQPTATIDYYYCQSNVVDVDEYP